jgi:uncharacterized protein YxeA
MKKVFILLMAIVAISVNAQDIKRNGANGETLEANDYLMYYTGVATDTITTNQDSVAVAWYVKKPEATYYDFIFKLNEATAGGKATVKLQAKKFAVQAWSDVTSVTYYGAGSTGADTTILFTQTSTKQFYNYYRFLVVSVAAKTKITSISGCLKY